MDPEGTIPLAEIRRRRRTEALRAALPYSPGWEAWLEGSGEDAPDFDALVPRPRLWSPVEGLAGAGEWPTRIASMRERIDHWVLGSTPPAPGDVDVDVMDEHRDGGTVDRALEVTFAEGAGRLRARLVMPDSGAPFGVVLIPPCYRWWAAAALRRGWAACLVRAGDGCDDSEAFAELYPGNEWRRLARRGWAFSRAVDALVEMPEIDGRAIVAAGLGPDAKVALVAAAADARITAVAAVSSGVLGAIPVRLCAERHFGPGVEGLTRRHPHWFHPRLRFFAGREHLLPTDAHELLSLVAPRSVLLSTALNDPAESTWAAERAADAVRPVYELLGAPAGQLTLRWREGGAECTPETWEAVLDWAEHAVGRRREGVEVPPRLHLAEGVTWPAPLAPNRALLGPTALAAEIDQALGEAPPAAPDTVADELAEPVHTAALLGRTHEPAQVVRRTVRTPDGVPVDVHVPAGPGAFPLVLWLGPLARATGYATAPGGEPTLWDVLTGDGWAVACFDALGTGSRLHEEAGFRRRHPRWSPLGRMVRDARGALAAACSLPEVDGRAAWLVGYGAGAVVALHTAALDGAVAGLVAVAPAAGDVPLLAGEPEYGIADLLGVLGRRRALVVSPAVDPEADPEDVAAAVRAAAGEHAAVEHAVLPDHHRFSRDACELVRLWLAGAAGRRIAAA